jgi:hypothetical protein
MPNRAIDILKVTILTILLSVLFTVVMASILSFFWGKDVTIGLDWVETIGTLTETNYGGEGGAAKFRYVVNSVEFEEYSGAEICHRGEGYVKGEKYRIKANPQKPKEFEVLIWAPIFTSDEETARTIGIVTKIYQPSITLWGLLEDTISSAYSIRFKYCPDKWNNAIVRSQDMVPNFRKTYPNVKEGQQYVLEYLKNDPRRALIHMDKPIKMVNKHSIPNR